jgi:hypothetical protein
LGIDEQKAIMKTIRTNSPVAGQRWAVFALAAAGLLSGASAVSAASLKGQVLGAGEPVAQSTVTLWAASAGAPKQLAQVRTDAQGRFSLTAPGRATGHLALPRGPGWTIRCQQGRRQQPGHRTDHGAGQQGAVTAVTINEMTTIASVWTHNQFINGARPSRPSRCS